MTDHVTDAEDADFEDTPDAAGDRKALFKGLLIAAATLLLVGATVTIATVAGRTTLHPRPSKTFTFTIPLGTSNRVEAGQIPFDVFPAELEVQVGDTIVIRNDDTPTHIVGPFVIRPAETLTYLFRQSGTYRGLCTVHGNGHEVTIRVVKALPVTTA